MCQELLFVAEANDHGSASIHGIKHVDCLLEMSLCLYKLLNHSRELLGGVQVARESLQTADPTTVTFINKSAACYAGPIKKSQK